MTTWHGFASAIVAAAEPHTGRKPEVSPITTADYPTPASRPKNSELASDLFERTFGVRAALWEQRAREVVDVLLTKAPQPGASEPEKAPAPASAIPAPQSEEAS